MQPKSIHKLVAAVVLLLAVDSAQSACQTGEISLERLRQQAVTTITGVRDESRDGSPVRGVLLEPYTVGNKAINRNGDEIIQYSTKWEDSNNKAKIEELQVEATNLMVNGLSEFTDTILRVTSSADCVKKQEVLFTFPSLMVHGTFTVKTRNFLGHIFIDKERLAMFDLANVAVPVNFTTQLCKHPKNSQPTMYVTKQVGTITYNNQTEYKEDNAAVGITPVTDGFFRDKFIEEAFQNKVIEDFFFTKKEHTIGLVMNVFAEVLKKSIEEYNRFVYKSEIRSNSGATICPTALI